MIPGLFRSAAARVSAAAIAVAAASAAASAAAAGVAVSPVLVELSPKQRVGSVRLENKSALPITVQADAARWTQVDGTNKYQATDDLLVAPAIAEIAPGAAQVFRVTPRGAFPTAGEQAYRLYLEDVTPADPAGGLAVRYRQDLPVMVSAGRAGEPAPRLSVCPGARVGGCVRLHNDGDRRLRVSALRVESGGQAQEIKVHAAVLAGAWQDWTFEAKPGPLTVTAETTAGTAVLQIAAHAG